MSAVPYELQLLWVQHEAIEGDAPSDTPTWIACPMGFSPKNGRPCVHLYVRPLAAGGSAVLAADDAQIWEYAIFLNYAELCRAHSRVEAGGVLHYYSAREALVIAERDFFDLARLGWRAYSDAELVEAETEPGRPFPAKPFLRRIADKRPWALQLPAV
ncbi:MAG: hypothetical protein E6Q97_20200 [Desulfurellales bacterium]|nr:MAG: hypothetical protein E6Q97_20200 [Desulfurellales bacterium]